MHFCWNFDVADGKDFVDQQDLGVQVSGNGEGKSHVHAAGIALDRRVDELLDLGEIHDRVELATDFGPFMPRMAPFRKIFSRPVSSAWKPVPTSNRLPTRP